MASIPVQESGDSGISLFCESYQVESTSEGLRYEPGQESSYVFVYN